jgi:DNA-binding Lrp family transcriptional regulator
MVIAYTLVKSESGKEGSVMAALRERKEVKEISLTYGVFDIVAKIEVDSPEALDNFIFEYLRRIQAVKETTTLMTSRIEAVPNSE